MSKIVDEHCKDKGIVLEHNNKIYSCVLNQTDVATNSNKFYIMQIVSMGNNNYTHFIRYGRTGETGTFNCKSFSNVNDVVFAFEKQFKTKTGNNFNPSVDFVKKPGKYFMSKVTYDDELDKVKDNIVPQPKPQSKLCDRLQFLIGFLTNVQYMQQSLVSLNIDVKKMPLGKITSDQLDMANKVLDELQPIISAGVTRQTKELLELSSSFYTYLPMNFGRKKPPIISTQEMITNYKDAIIELKNMVVTVSVTDVGINNVNPLDSIYDKLKTRITPMDKGCNMWNMIEQYVKNTKGSTHYYNLELMEVYEIDQDGKKDKFDDYTKNIGNKYLLFHGSCSVNWCSILLNDLLIYPQAVSKNVVITGKMFSNGIYFASCVSKSFSYCRTETSNNIGVLALAEVALGNIGKRINFDYNITPESLKKEKCDSIHGMGRYTSFGNVNKVDDVVIPNGVLSDTGSKSLLYDEHVIYNSNQQKIKYLILVKNVK